MEVFSQLLQLNHYNSVILCSHETNMCTAKNSLSMNVKILKLTVNFWHSHSVSTHFMSVRGWNLLEILVHLDFLTK